MDVQYVSDSQGKTTSVIIPIEDWNKIKDRYEEVKKKEKSKKKPSDYEGCISIETAERIIADIQEGRKQWERNI